MAPLRSRAARRALALAAGLALAAALLEGGTRVWLRIGGRPFDAELAARRIEESNLHVQGADFAPEEAGSANSEHGMILHPYLGYQLQRVSDVRDGKRDYWRSPEADENFDLLVLGGSVAAGFIGAFKDEFLPLWRADPHFAGRKLTLHWRTCPGHKEPQHAINLQWAFSVGDKPDLVILIDGFNEVAVAAGNADHGIHPLFPMWTEMEANLAGPTWSAREYELIGELVELRREAQRMFERSRSWGFAHSAVLGTLMERELRGLAGQADRKLSSWTELRAAAKGKYPPLIAGPAYSKDAQAVRELSLDAWIEGSRTIHAACKARGIAFVHVLQPAARDIGSKPLSEDEDIWTRDGTVWREAVEQGYPRLREAGAMLAKEGVDFLDASGVFKGHPETLYRDACHFEQPGYGLLSKLIVEHLREVLPPPR